MDSNFKCGKCKWWEGNPSATDPANLGAGPVIGTCHRLPPVVLTTWTVDKKTDTFQPSPPQMVQPLTGKNDWCGEWKAKIFDTKDGAM